jgi:hypothetical protein
MWFKKKKAICTKVGFVVIFKKNNVISYDVGNVTLLNVIAILTLLKFTLSKRTTHYGKHEFNSKNFVVWLRLE